MVTETDLVLGDGRTLHAYDTGTGDGAAGLALFWHHGTPGTGAPPEPLFAAADARGIRWLSYDRPGYGGGSPPPGPGGGWRRPVLAGGGRGVRPGCGAAPAPRWAARRSGAGPAPP